MRFVIYFVALTFIGCGPPTNSGGGGGPARTRCTTADDCRGDFICESSRCVRGAGSRDAGVSDANRPPLGDGGSVARDAGENTDGGGVTPPGDAGTRVVCGNGVRELGESCDDGNGSNNDACTNECVPNICGDGFVYLGFEECDDGNLEGGDGCSMVCTVERGPQCGNNIVEEGEQCDDGNNVDGDGCDAQCQEEAGNLDHGDTPAEAMRITVPAEVNAAVDNATDRDYFRFFSTATATYVVETTGGTDTICAIEFTGNLVAADDDGGAGLNCRVSAHLSAGRTYHIRVSGVGGDTGPYVLTVTR